MENNGDDKGMDEKNKPELLTQVGDLMRVPQRLAALLEGHEVRTAPEMTPQGSHWLSREARRFEAPLFQVSSLVCISHKLARARVRNTG